jgi:hypothetical protein
MAVCSYPQYNETWILVEEFCRKSANATKIGRQMKLDRAINPEQASKALQSGDALEFVRSAQPLDTLWSVFDNMDALKQAGVYEAALIQGYTLPATAGDVPDSLIELLFGRADRERLLLAGNPLPPGEHFTIYRGVSGFSPNRRNRGWSWSLSKETAEWFANRFGFFGDPAVYQAEIDRREVLAYVNDRQEQEILCRPKELVRLTPALSLADAMLPANVRYEKWASGQRAAGLDAGTITVSSGPTTQLGQNSIQLFANPIVS